MLACSRADSPQILYHGAREQVMPFFSSIGLVCPPHKADADFLQEVANKTDQAVRVSKCDPV